MLRLVFKFRPMIWITDSVVSISEIRGLIQLYPPEGSYYCHNRSPSEIQDSLRTNKTELAKVGLNRYQSTTSSALPTSFIVFD